MFLQHLDTELEEEDVQKITSGTKAKAQITVLSSQAFAYSICYQSILTTVDVCNSILLFLKCSGQNWELYCVHHPWRGLEASAHTRIQTCQFSTKCWRPAGRM